MDKEEKKKNKDKKVKKVGFMQGVMSLMFSQILIKILGLIYTMYLTNKKGYGDYGNGISAGAYNLYTLLLTVSSIGVPSAISKLIAEMETQGDEKGIKKVFNISLLTFGLLGLIGSAILFFGASTIANNFLQIPEATMTLVCLSPSVFIVSIASVFRGYFNGREQLQITAKSQGLEQIYKTVLTIIFVEVIGIYTKLNTPWMAAGANLATTLSTFLGFAYMYRFYRFAKKEALEKAVKEKEIIEEENEEAKEEKKKKEKKSYANLKALEILKKVFLVSIPITLTAVMSSISKNIDSLTVVSGLKTFMSEIDATRMFGILNWKADTLANLPLALNIAFSTALVPAIAAARAKKDQDTIVRRSSSSMMFSMLIGLPCMVGMIVLAEPILKLLFPQQPEGALVLQILATSIIFTILAQNLNSILQGYGKLYMPIIALLCGVIAKYFVNITLIPNPNIGIYGAAIGSVVCQVLSFIISYVAVAKVVKFNYTFSEFILKPALASGIMALSAMLVYKLLVQVLGNTIACVIAILVAVVIYLLEVVIFKILNEEQITSLPKGEKIYNFLKKVNIY